MLNTLPLVLAHAGHDGHAAGFAAGLVHPWLGLDHLLAMVMVGLLAVRLAQRGTTTDRRWWLIAPALFVGAMLMGAAWAALAPLGGSIEWVVAASVILLGVSLAAAPKRWLLATLPVVPIAGVFHGYAHLTEVTGSTLGYLTGMTLATAALHVIGIAGGLLLAGALRQPAAVRWTAATMTAGFACVVALG